MDQRIYHFSSFQLQEQFLPLLSMGLAKEHHQRVVDYPLTKGIQHSSIFIMILPRLSFSRLVKQKFQFLSLILLPPVISLPSFLICFVTLKILSSCYLISANFLTFTLWLALYTIKILAFRNNSLMISSHNHISFLQFLFLSTSLMFSYFPTDLFQIVPDIFYNLGVRCRFCSFSTTFREFSWLHYPLTSTNGP